METLFSELETETGFKLDYLEILNWGGFHNKVWRVTPDSESILVTGANGCGKTTLVDALVTLLVPPQRRHYNQSSGNERKRDRTEETYVRGAYGSMRGDEPGRSDLQMLRDRSCYSILIANFKGNASGDFCVAQVRRFTAAGLQRDYITADCPLLIEEHFLPLDDARSYRQACRDLPGFTTYDSFVRYAGQVVRSLGLRSQKGLNLFSQIVGVKQIENLNGFIRAHMLEESSMEEEFVRLHTDYQNLLQTHNRIEMAELQSELLRGVEETGTTYTKILEEFSDLEYLSDGIPMLFADLLKSAATRILAVTKEAIRRLEVQREAVKKWWGDKDRELTSVRDAIALDETAGRIREIESEIRRYESVRDTARRSYDRYLEAAEVLGLQAPKTERIFESNHGALSDLATSLRSQSDSADEESRRLHSEKRDLELKIVESRTERESLKGRRSNIPRRSLEIRDSLCDALEVAADVLPFIGELIQVMPEETRWEQSAERLLHGFALSVIIPENLYTAAARYINSHDLRGRLVFFRVGESPGGAAGEMFEAAENTLPTKLVVKESSPYCRWVTSNLINRFEYLCTDDLKILSHSRNAVTSSGLIKGRNRHEKDDRPGRWGVEMYVLGWDNSRKIAWLGKQIDKLQGELDKLSVMIVRNRDFLENLRDKSRAADSLARFDGFKEVDWSGPAAEISRFDTESKRLLNKAVSLKALKEKETELLEEREKLDSQKEELAAEIATHKTKVRSAEDTLTETSNTLSAYTEDDLAELPTLSQRIDEYMPEDAASDSIEAIRTRRQKAGEMVAAEIKRMSSVREKAVRDLGNAMNRFLNPGQEQIRQFPGWYADTRQLQPDPEYLEDFLSLQKRIDKDELPKYKREFKAFMNDRMFENIIAFSNTLDLSRRRIESDIAQLNESLRSVSYSRAPETYIALTGESTRDVAVQDFRALLSRSAGDVGRLGKGDDAELEAAFLRIQKLILRLAEDEAWRKKVLDVRNWLEFSAVEYYRDDDTQKQYYQDSMSLSGGEKAKLAYTILASAIAYQYGLRESDRKRSFSFVIVDEVFSKVDPVNSEYAMELFKAMGLQLMIVTPLDRINIVENYIGSVCFIEKQNEQSIPHKLTMEDYRNLKEEYEAAGQ